MTALTADQRLALEATFVAYCATIDRREDAVAASDYFTEDGVMDNRALGNPLVEGRSAQITAISGMFAAMDRMEHFLSNFLVTGYDGDVVQAQWYVQAFGLPNGGEAFTLRGIYRLAMKRIGDDWKIDRLTFQPFA